MAIGGTTAWCVLLLLCLGSVVFAGPVVLGKKPGKDVGKTEFEAGMDSTSPNQISVPITKFGDIPLNVNTTFTFTVPGVIPCDAKAVLLYVRVSSAATTEQMQSVKIFTQIGSHTYAKYLMLYTYPRVTINNANSENMWFPMSYPNCSVSVFITYKLRSDSETMVQLFAIGYHR